MERSTGIRTAGRRKRPRLAIPDASRLGRALLVLAAGVVAGSQIVAPNKRAIQAVVGVVLVLLMWNFSSLAAVWFLALMYPFPFGIAIGNSNFIFSVLFFVIYLIRVATGEMKISFDRRVALPVGLLMLAYILSFYNVDPGERVFHFGLVNTGNFFGAVLFMFLVINLVDDEVKLRATVKIMLVTALLVIAFTIIEMLFPGRTIIPYWLHTRHAARLVMEGVRMGGPFHDYELAAEFFAINALLIFFMLVRSKRLLTRSFLAALLVVDMTMMFSTITRGAFISLAIGVVYLAFLCRRDLNIVRLFSLAGAVALMVFVLEFFVAGYTISGSLFDRLVQTTFEHGLVPDTRTVAWSQAIERGMRHPLLGSGPGWDFAAGITRGYWPHCQYLFYFNITGIFGLGAFLFLLYRLGRATCLGLRVSIVSSPFPEALMLVLHVCFVIFVIDQIKIDYVRNDRYTYFVWLLFGLIVATANVIERNRSAARVTSAETSRRG